MGSQGKASRARGARARTALTRVAIAAAAACLTTPFGIGGASRAAADASAPVTNTNPSIFASSFSAQALVPTTEATLQLDDSYSWVHGFFNKGQPDLPVNAAEYSEVFDPGFLGGAVLFTAATDPTPLSDPNNFPGYAFASYPVPQNQESIQKCVSPTSQVAAPCTPASPDEAVSVIDPSAPKGSSFVSTTGPGGGTAPTGFFSGASNQSIQDGSLVEDASAAGHNVTFAFPGGQNLQVSGFKAFATSKANAQGVVSGTATCTVGSITAMGQTVAAGPGGQLDLSKVDALLAQLSQATNQKISMTAAPKPTVTPGDHKVESTCSGPSLTIGNALPGPLGTLNVGQKFILGTADVSVGASPPLGGGDLGSITSSGTTVGPGGGTVDTNAPGAPPPAGTDTSGGVGGGAASPTSGVGGLTSASPGGGLAAAGPGAGGAPSSGTPSAQGASGGGGSGSTPLQYRNASSNAPSQGWLTFLLTMVSGLVILGTAFGVGGTISRMARAWRESVSPLG
ncbi:MAG TPA: hypothetical protein VG476_02130 [Acidimicrobiales bacterium]|nr:hypothetical protein [Acidimicrobiales bacterium]